ncbi:MAG TPA: tRNA (adenosine(37)-N6)-threonylcarbamoyltransferase complex dimerization subunit type 1 TsaB [Gemmatimonadaceae bacterium]|nr:tRNA (adenosine(37)-N6)-threonylcarbamoyltransferase complex dimerization subunit type 1 TsaB [Gemmatimonadaceae bacterium]
MKAGSAGGPHGLVGAGGEGGRDPFTLALDASTYVGTVAVLHGSSVVAESQAVMRGELEERLMPAVAGTLREAGCAVRDVARVVCGAGPGSFTSLRIAAAVAKGLALGRSAAVRETPLYAVSSLALIVAGHVPPLGAGRYLALLDALRGERYAALFEIRGDGCVCEVVRPSGGRIPATGIDGACAQFDARAIGPLEVLRAEPHARGVARLLGPIVAVGPVVLDMWEPEYGRLAEAQRRWEAEHGRELPGART